MSVARLASRSYAQALFEEESQKSVSPWNGHLKRSEINALISEAIEFFKTNHFSLPPFANWSLDEWSARKDEKEEIRLRELGWDVTDFGSGAFASCGLTLFTLRNGSSDGGHNHKPYAEKIMMVREQQITPLHFHFQKTEDIINRGGTTTGDLVVRLYNSTEDYQLAETPITVTCDGAVQHIGAGETILLKAGESITLQPRLYHTFHAVNGNALIGEVSSVNDDADDNHFYEAISRFPEIVEDEPPIRLLCTEYSRYIASIKSKSDRYS